MEPSETSGNYLKPSEITYKTAYYYKTTNFNKEGDQMELRNNLNVICQHLCPLSPNLS